MITINKEATSISEAVGMTSEQFEAFGTRNLEALEEYAAILMSGDKDSISRLDFLEKLSTIFSEEELLIIALTAFEDNLQKVIQFKQQEAHEAAQALDASHTMTAERVATMEVVKDDVAETVAFEEIPANPETPDPIV